MINPDASAAALELRAVSHRFGGELAISGANLAMAEGEILCLVGSSGCGKSTLLRIIAGLERLQDGEITISGHVVSDPETHLPPERRGVGLVFQDYALFPHLTVVDNVAFGLDRLGADERRRRVSAALAQVGMSPFENAFPHVLSGGQQQRVALARALAPGPKILLLDEPFSGLDSHLRARVRDETLHVLKKNRVATLVVTHDPEEAMFLADRIALMRAGRVVQEGHPIDLYCRPANPFAASFFGEVNQLYGEVRAHQASVPLGLVPAPGHADGTRVTVLVRPEALSLTTVVEGAPATIVGRVEAARLLGRTSLVHLTVLDGDGGDGLHLHARMPGQFLPQEGSSVGIAMDLRQVFVFPDDRP